MQRAGWRRSLGCATLCAVRSLLSAGLARPGRRHRVTPPVRTLDSAAGPPAPPDRVPLSDGASTLRKSAACPSRPAVPIWHTRLHAVLPSRSLRFLRASGQRRSRHGFGVRSIPASPIRPSGCGVGVPGSSLPCVCGNGGDGDGEGR